MKHRKRPYARQSQQSARNQLTLGQMFGFCFFGGLFAIYLMSDFVSWKSLSAQYHNAPGCFQSRKANKFGDACTTEKGQVVYLGTSRYSQYVSLQNKQKPFIRYINWKAQEQDVTLCEPNLWSHLKKDDLITLKIWKGETRSVEANGITAITESDPDERVRQSTIWFVTGAVLLLCCLYVCGGSAYIYIKRLYKRKLVISQSATL